MTAAGPGQSFKISPSMIVKVSPTPQAARQFCVFLQVARLAVHRNGDLRPQPRIHILELFAPRMSRDVHQRFGVGDEIDAKPGEPILHARHGLLVAGYRTRREDDEIAFVERDVGMLVGGNTGDGGAHLALAAGAHDHDLVARQIGKPLLVEIRKVLRQVSGFGRHFDDAMERTSGDDERPAGGVGRRRDRCKARDIRGKARHGDAARRTGDDLGQRFSNVGLGRRASLRASHSSNRRQSRARLRRPAP